MLARISTQLSELRYAPPCLPCTGGDDHAVWICVWSVAEVTNTSTTRAHCLHMEKNFLRQDVLWGVLHSGRYLRSILTLELHKIRKLKTS